MVRLLAIDIDGTLLDSHGHLPPAHLDALVQTAARDVAIALVTGRSFHFTRPLADALPFPLTLILNNGALVKDATGGTAMRLLVPRQVALDVLASTHAFEDSVSLLFDRPDERQIMFERLDWMHPNRRGYYEKNKAFIAATSRLADALVEDPVQVMFSGQVERMRALVADLRAMPFAGSFSVAVTEYEARDFALVDVNGPHCSKGATLARWAAARGVAREDVMAVGDNLNDVEMLEFAGTPVVMGNAVDALKRRGWMTTGTNNENGLATALQRLGLST